MPSIAVLGTEVAGKTVLVSCLVKYVQQKPRNGIAFDPQSASAQHYVDEVWRRLNNQDWPPSTPPGQFSVLEWLLHLPGIAPIPFWLIDPPGQDLRQLFSADANPADVPSDLQQLVNTVHSSEIVILLVNLAEFLGRPDDDHRMGSQLTLKFILDACLRRQPAPHIALVFTQADRFPDKFKASNVDYYSIFTESLPLVYESMTRHPLFAAGGIQTFAVSAVNKTRMVVDANNVARNVPAPGFQSEGFDGLLQWIQVAATKPPTGVGNKPKFWWNVFFVASIIIFLMRSCSGTPKANTKNMSNGTNLLNEKKTFNVPAPKIVSATARYSYVKLLDWDVVVDGQVRNDGGTGLVTVYASLQCGQRQWIEQTVIHQIRGATSAFQLNFKDYDSGKAKFAVATTRESVQNPSANQPVPE